MPLLAGDSFVHGLGLARLDIIKLDVEGMETSVIRGLAQTIDRFEPIVLMEWNNDVTRNLFVAERLFSTVFAKYARIGVREPWARELFPSNMFGHFRRRITRLRSKREFAFVSFAEAANLETLLLVPHAKVAALPRVRAFLARQD